MIPALLWVAQNITFYAEMTFKSARVRKFFAVASASLGVLLAALGIWFGSDWWFGSAVLITMAISALTEVYGNQKLTNEERSKEWLGLQALAIVGATYGLLGAVNLFVSFNRQQAIIAFVFCFLLLLNYRLGSFIARVRPTRHALSESKQLPTVSLLIPARNEDHALEACLRAAVNSDYEKLEILVLDDCSHDKTPGIIRDFAQSGVRFVEGQITPEGWLGKNYAVDQLITAANGDLLIITDVDVHISERTISGLVATQMATRAEVTTIQPQHREERFKGAFFAPSRLFWRALANTFKVRPLGFSPVQMLTKEFASKVENVSRLKNSYKYYLYWALWASKADAFVSTTELGISISKRPRSFVQNQIRAGFPFVGRSLVWVAVSVLVYLSLFAYPVLVSVRTNSILAPITLLLLLLAYARIVRLEMPRLWWVALALAPLKFTVELVLLVTSTARYLLGKIYWKERNICLPALQVHKSLPKI